MEDFVGKHRTSIAEDIDSQPVYLAKSAWDINYAAERYPRVVFHRAKERG